MTGKDRAAKAQAQALVQLSVVSYPPWWPQRAWPHPQSLAEKCVPPEPCAREEAISTNPSSQESEPVLLGQGHVAPAGAGHTATDQVGLPKEWVSRKLQEMTLTDNARAFPGTSH